MTFEAFEGHLFEGSFRNTRKAQTRLNSLEICEKNSDTTFEMFEGHLD